MKKILLSTIFALSSASMFALPTPDFQDPGTVNITLSSESAISTTFGAYSENNIKSDVGINFDLGRVKGASLVAKIGTEEGIGNIYTPSFNVGISQAGIRTKHQFLEHQNIFHVMTSKSLRRTLNGRVYVGAFHGNRIMGKDRKGVFVGYTQYLFPTQIDETKKYDKAAVDLVYVSGKSSLGGFTVLGKYYVTPKISIQGGPTWFFNEYTIEKSKWSFEKVHWTVLLSIDL